MRIIAGDKRGTRLESLPGEATRPTLERVKEAVFSSVQFLVPGARVLDLFAGSGQMGLEALSRGAESCVFIDNNRLATQTIIANARHAGLFEKCKVATMEARSFLEHNKGPFDLAFLDPPYRQGTLQQVLPLLAGALAPGAIVLCESETDIALPPNLAGLALEKQYRYGQVLVSRYRLQQANELAFP